MIKASVIAFTMTAPAMIPVSIMTPTMISSF